MQTHITKKKFLSSVPFQYLEPKELELLVTYSKIVTFNSGEILLRQGEVSEGMYIIIEGEALVSAKVLGKNLTNLAILSSGDFIGEVSLLEKSPSATTAMTKTLLHCLLITNVYFDMLAIFFPEIRYKITKAIVESICIRLNKLHDDIIKIIKQSNIISRFDVKNIITSLINPSPLSLDKAQIDLMRLKEWNFFKSFSKNEYEDFLKHVTLLKAPSNCTLIKEDEKNIIFYLIIKGAVQSNISDDNKRVKLAVWGPMSLFGNIFYINENPSIASYTTCEPVLLLKMDSASLSHLQTNNIHLWYKIYDCISKSFIALAQSAEKLYIRLNGEIYNR